MMIISLELRSEDLHKTKKFYTEILGLEMVTSGNTVTCRIGETTLSFIEDKTIQPIYHFAIEIPHNQLIEAYNWIHSKVEIIPAGKDKMFSDFVSWNAQSFYFTDLNGNLLEFICRYDLLNASAAPFSPESMLYISEIGIVTENVSSMIAQLENQYGIKPFIKQPPMENFAALGDEEGLLIVVQDGRNWFPTEIPAQHAACHIKWKSGEEIIDIYL